MTQEQTPTPAPDIRTQVRQGYGLHVTLASDHAQWQTGPAPASPNMRGPQLHTREVRALAPNTLDSQLDTGDARSLNMQERQLDTRGQSAANLAGVKVGLIACLVLGFGIALLSVFTLQGELNHANEVCQVEFQTDCFEVENQQEK